VEAWTWIDHKRLYIAPEPIAVSIVMEPALFFALPHFLTANRIHFAEKCSSRLLKKSLVTRLVP
jgi:hypothetical protein